MLPHSNWRGWWRLHLSMQANYDQVVYVTNERVGVDKLTFYLLTGRNFGKISYKDWEVALPKNSARKNVGRDMNLVRSYSGTA